MSCDVIAVVRLSWRLASVPTMLRLSSVAKRNRTVNTVPNLGDTIAELRTSHGWSQEALAAAANVSVRTVQRIESGQPGAIEAVGAIARAFDLDVDRLQRLRDNLDTLSRLVRFPAVKTAQDLIRITAGAEAHVIQVEAQDQRIRDVAHTLAGNAGDWNDIGMEPAMVPHAEKDLGALLEELETAGGRLFCFRRPWPSEFKDRKGQVVMFDTLFFVVYPKDHTAIERGDDGKEFLVSLRDRDDHEFLKV